jgi:hypothetical protein
MTTWLYVQCVLMFLLGQAVHIFLIKVPAVKERARAANKKFSWAEWWGCDWNVIIGTLIIGLLITLGLDEILKWKPVIWDYVKWFYAGIGAFGSTIALAKFSQFEKGLTALIDVKTNIADETVDKEEIDKQVKAQLRK